MRPCPRWNRPLLAAGLALAAAAPTPVGARVLQNDTAQPGAAIAFYPRLEGGEYAASLLDVPEDLAQYQICAINTWIGPNDFNVFQLDIFSAGPDGLVGDDIFRNDLDAFQLFGSEQDLNEIDLRTERIVTDARHLYVRLTHVEGFPAPPTIASDADGIVPQHNFLSGLMRDGTEFAGPTETLPLDGLYPQPPGDWIIRAVVVGMDEDCPSSGAQVPDGGVIVVPPDAGRPPPPPPEQDAGGPKPDSTAPDLGLPPPWRDAEPTPLPDSTIADTDGPEGTLGPLAVLRVAPDRGQAGVNTELTIDGRGFPTNGDVEILLGTTPALGVSVLSDTLIDAVAPAELAPGTYDLIVARGDGVTASLTHAFTVTGTADEALSLSGVLPSSIVEQSLPTLTLLGRGFTDGTEFFVGPVLLQGVELVSPQRATAVLSTGLSAGTYAVTARDGDREATLATPLTVMKSAARSDGCGCHVGRPAPARGGLFLLPLALWCVGRRRRGPGGTGRP